MVALAGCQGLVSGFPDDSPGAPERPGPGRQPVLCESDTVAPSTDIARLTRFEYGRTLRDLLGQEVAGAATNALALVPADRGEHTPDRLSQDVSSNHVRAYASVATAVGAFLEADEDARRNLVPCLGESECIEDFIESFASEAYRRPLLESERAALLTTYDRGASESPALGLNLLVQRVLQAPAFIFRPELGDEPAADGVEFALTDHEIASRLSFYLWAAPPDDALRRAANARELSDPAQIEAHLDRMLDDPRAREGIRRFYTQWLVLDRSYDIDNLTGPIAESVEDTENLTAAAHEEVDRLLDFVLFDMRGTYADLMTTPVGFTHTPSLAEIYGVEPGTVDDPMVMLDREQRSGLLTRVGMLAGDNGHTTPFHRGVFVARRMLCRDLQIPPNLDENATSDPPADPEATTRQRYEAKTSPAACAGCHRQFNPFGFALEMYDGAGQFRTEEFALDEDEIVVGSLPIDAAVDPGLQSSDAVNGAVELGAALGSDPEAIQCAAVQWYEYSRRTRVRTAEDSCAVEDIGDAARAESLYEMIRRLPLRPEFVVRRIEPNP
ncbi:MAG: DUF1592 domain-containing protein [Myxococcota bacterium]